MAEPKKTPAKTKTPPPTPESPAAERAKSSSDYIEFRIPRFSLTRIPLLFVILLILLAFGAGYFSQHLAQQSAPVPITDQTSAFVAYAKQLGMDTDKFKSCYTTSKYESQVEDDMNAGSQAQVNATPSFFINGQPVVGALPYSVFKSMIDQQLTGGPTPTPMLSETPAPPQDVSNGHLPIEGNKNAKVKVVEFSDFQCPFCEQFYQSTYPQLKKDYIDTGKISFAYRQFPLTSIHPSAKPAALASECANEQGKFWDYYNLLFKNQNTWVNLPAASTTTVQ